MQLSVRQLKAHELDWANQRYAEVDFLPSPPTDYIAVAELDGVPAGLGRVTRLGPDVGELGGMYVFPEQRGAGVSRALIAHLIACAGAARLYCLPFEELLALYASAGFKARAADATVPDKVLRKHAWCNSHYPKPVLLLYRDGPATSAEKIALKSE